jgi:hypothetical protein
MTDTSVEQESDRTSDPTLNSGAFAPLRPTAVDATGTERIAGPPVDRAGVAWTPAQVEPTDDEIATMERHNAKAAERRGERLGALTDPANVDDTAQPLIDANQARADELDAAGDGSTPDVTDVTPPPVEPEGTPDPVPPVDEGYGSGEVRV